MPLHSTPYIITPNVINICFKPKVSMPESLDWVVEAEMEKTDILFNYLNAKLTEIIDTT